MTIDGVASGATALAYEHRGGRLRISLPERGERRSVTVRYHGTTGQANRV